MPSRTFAAAVAALSLLALPAAAQAAKAKPSYYVSLGDSYAAGYQRFTATDARTTRDGFAYQVVGNGPIDLVFVMGWVSHLECFWTEPTFARFLRRLAEFSRVILFDKRGTGLSDRSVVAGGRRSEG